MNHSHPDHFDATASIRGSRRVPPAWVLGTAAAVLATSIGVRAVAAGSQPSPAAGQATQANGQAIQDEEAFAALGEATTEKVCVICHPWDNITQKRRTVSQWDAVIVDMTMRGAPGTPDQFKIVKKFLARYYGLVQVNTASAEEFSTVLGLSMRDAEAIVAHRKAHGKFTDAAALKAVAGIDLKKIQEQTVALIFD